MEEWKEYISWGLSPRYTETFRNFANANTNYYQNIMKRNGSAYRAEPIPMPIKFYNIVVAPRMGHSPYMRLFPAPSVRRSMRLSLCESPLPKNSSSYAFTFLHFYIFKFLHFKRKRPKALSFYGALSFNQSSDRPGRDRRCCYRHQSCHRYCHRYCHPCCRQCCHRPCCHHRLG